MTNNLQKDLDTPQKRLKHFIEKHYETQAAFAEAVDSKYQNINKYINTDKVATMRLLSKWRDKAGLNPAWYKTGEGEMLLSDSKNDVIDDRYLELDIKVYEAPAYANVGTLTSIEDLSYNIKKVAIKEKYLDPDKISGLRVRGSSMEGKGIFENDLLIFSKEIKPENNKTVVVNINGCIMVKLWKDNKLYSVPKPNEYEEIPEYHDDNGHLIGTVFQIIREDV